jgi:hypothetical protein
MPPTQHHRSSASQPASAKVKTKAKAQNAALHTAIDALSAEAIAALIPFVEELKTASETRNAVMLRGVKALTRIPTKPATLRRAIQASTDYDFLANILSAPEVSATLPSDDPLSAARLRGTIAKTQLLSAEGGCIPTKEVKVILGISEQAIDKRRRAGKLIALPAGRSYVFPRWQFTLGSTLPGLEAVLQRLAGQINDPWMQAAWMLNPNLQLGGKSPLVQLKRGHLEAVLQAAGTYGEQGAT